MQQVTSSFSVELISGNILDVEIIPRLDHIAMSRMSAVLHRFIAACSDEDLPRPPSQNDSELFQDVEINDYRTNRTLPTNGLTVAVNQSYNTLRAALNVKASISISALSNKLVINIRQD